MKRLQHFIEQHAFGVCTWLGELLTIPTSSIRITFIYASFLTLGSPLLIYLALAFIKNFPQHFRKSRNSVWYF